MTQKIAIVFALLLAFCPGIKAQEAAVEMNTDTEESTEQQQYTTFRPKKLIAPLSLIAGGAVLKNTGLLEKQVRRINIEVGKTRKDNYVHADDYLQYAPMIATWALPVVGVKPRYNFRDRLATTATAWVIMGVAVNGIKYTVREQRPDCSTRNSFPSGHTATVFLGAETMRMQYGNTAGAIAYAFASGVGAMRIWNNRHFVNDVLAGAGIGILSVRAAAWLLPVERKLLGWDKSTKGGHADFTFMPYYDSDNHAIGTAGAIVF